MEHLWTLASVLVGAFLGYLFAGLGDRSRSRRNTYDETIRFLAEYRVQATGAQRVINAPLELLARAVWLDRKIADPFSKAAFEAWRDVYSFISAGWFPEVRTYEFDQARQKALDEIHEDLSTFHFRGRRSAL